MAPEKTNPNNLGGELLGMFMKGFRRASKPVNNVVMEQAKGANDRYRGRVAEIAEQTENPVGRVTLQLIAGRRDPFNRGKIGVENRANESITRRTEEARREVHRLYENVTNRHGEAAGKAAVIELGGNDNDLVAQESIVFLLRTASWVDLQRVAIQGGPNQDKRLTKTHEWQHALSSPYNEHAKDLRALVSAKRPDWTPNIIESAQDDLGYNYEDIPGDPAHAHLLDGLDHRCMELVIRQFDAINLRDLHQGIYEEIGRLGDHTLSTDLFSALQNIKHAHGHVGADAISALGSIEKMAAVDVALAPCGLSYADI